MQYKKGNSAVVYLWEEEVQVKEEPEEDLGVIYNDCQAEEKSKDDNSTMASPSPCFGVSQGHSKEETKCGNSTLSCNSGDSFPDSSSHHIGK